MSANQCIEDDCREWTSGLRCSFHAMLERDRIRTEALAEAARRRPTRPRDPAALPRTFLPVGP